MGPIAEVGSTFVSVKPDAKGFGRSLDSQIGGEVKSSGSRSGKLFGGALKVGAVAALGGAAALAGFLKGALGEAREAQKVGALTNAVIKSTGGVANVTAAHVDKLSTSISNKIGVDDEAIAAGQNMLLTFGNVRNEVGKGNKIFDRATVSASDMAAAFGGDATSNSKLLGKALNDPTKGVSALTRVGVSFTAQQKKQITAMQESGNLLGAQKIILGEVSKQTKGAAAATATMGDKAKVAFGNLQETVGTALLPLWDKVLGGMTKVALFLTANIGPAFARLGAFLAPAKAAISAFFASLSGGGGGGALSGLIASFQAIGASIATNFLPVLKTMATTFTTVILPVLLRVGAYIASNLVPIFTKIGSIIATQVIPIIARLAQFFYGVLLPAIVKIATQIGGSLKPIFDQLFKTIQTSVLPAVQKLLAKFREWQPTIQKVILIVVKVIGAVLRLAAAILGRVLPPLIRFAGFLIRNVVSAVIAVIGVVVKIIGTIIRFGAAVIEGGRKVGQFAATVKDKIGAAIGFIKDIPGKAKSALGNLGGVLVNAGKALIQGLIDGIASKMAAAVQKVQDGLNKIKSMLPGSPIKTGPLKSWNNTGRTGPGGQLIGRIISGIDSQTGPLESSMTRLTSRISVPRLSVDASVGASGGAGAGRDGALVNIEQMITHDPAEAAYRLRVEQRKALTLAGMP